MDDQERIQTTEAHFNLFKKEAEYWIDKFQLREFKFNILHKDSEILPDTLAWEGTDWRGRVCTIGLSRDWGVDEITEYELSKCAFHEVCEVLLSDVACIAQIDICKTQKDELERANHAVIRRLEWVLWEPDYMNRKNTLITFMPGMVNKI